MPGNETEQVARSGKVNPLRITVFSLIMRQLRKPFVVLNRYVSSTALYAVKHKTWP